MAWEVQTSQSRGAKRQISASGEDDRPAKQSKLSLEISFNENDSVMSGLEDLNGAQNGEPASNYVLAVNQSFARRFEHNKRREELQQRMFGFLILGT